MSSPSINILCWNVRGLNNQARISLVQQTLLSTTCHLVCLQETKLTTVDQNLAFSLGGFNLRNFAHNPAEGTRGGILLLWNGEYIEVEGVLNWPSA